MPSTISGGSGPTLLTTDEVAELLGIKASTLKDWRWKGKGPPYAKLSGRRVRYRLCDVEEWIAGRVERAGVRTAPEGQ